ncbi:MAG: 4'-phosphopantetheinyl transferase superfamily protein [Bacteroidota bacterium]|nr:4'-phosphopantetheinyl transferase superfamily protein [Bacteroidota bacterium]
MPLFYQQNINQATQLAIWKIDEAESFFTAKVPLQRSISHPHKRLQHLAGRYLLQYLFPDFPYEEILIADTRKPYLPYEQYHFSISHCGDYAAAIVSSTKRVGIDIELPSAKVLKVAHKFLNEEERLMFDLHPLQVNACGTTFNDGRYDLPTLLWCAKEAMYKWWSWGDIDFSEMLRISAFEKNETGSMPAVFLRPGLHVPLNIEYKLFGGLCLAWVCADFSNHVL